MDYNNNDKDNEVWSCLHVASLEQWWAVGGTGGKSDKFFKAVS